MRQIDQPEEQPTLGPPNNRKAPEPAQPHKIKEGIQELGGKLMTDIAKNLAAPDDTPALCWTDYYSSKGIIEWTASQLQSSQSLSCSSSSLPSGGCAGVMTSSD